MNKIREILSKRILTIKTNSIELLVDIGGLIVWTLIFLTGYLIIN